MIKAERDEASHAQNDVATEVDPEKQLYSLTSTEPVQPAPEYEYITGIKLWLVLVSVTLTVFLMMVDESIIVTVSSILGKKLFHLSHKSTKTNTDFDIYFIIKTPTAFTLMDAEVYAYHELSFGVLSHSILDPRRRI